MAKADHLARPVQPLPGPPPKRGVAGRLSLGHLMMVASGLLAALITLSLLAQQDDSVQVAVAARDIAPMERLGPGSLEFVRAKAPARVLVLMVRREDASGLSGWIALNAIGRGQLVTRSQLVRPPGPADKAGNVAYSIQVEPEDAVIGALQPGDRVDVVAAKPDGPAGYVVLGAEVIDVAPGWGAGIGAGALGVRSRYAVTILVDRPSVPLLAAARASAKVSISRSTGATDVPNLPRWSPPSPSR